MWDHKKQKAKAAMLGASDFNIRITKYTERIQRCFNRFLNENGNQYPSKAALKNSLFIEFEKPLSKEVLDVESRKTFWGFFKHFVDDSINGIRKTKQGDAITKNTVANYKTLQKALMDFEDRRKVKISFETMDHQFYADLLQYFEKVKQYKKNTIQTQFRVLKTVIAEGFERGYHTNSKPPRFTAASESVTSIYLNEFELSQLYKLDLTSVPRLERVRDLFLLNCYTGGRFGDLEHITPKNIKPDSSTPEHFNLSYKQGKTKNIVTIPLFSEAIELLKKYDFRLPEAPSNQKFNEYIKSACEKLECLQEKVEMECTKGGNKVVELIPKYMCVSAHTARRSFATNAFLAGHPVKVIMAITGHRTEKSFNAYIRVTSSEMAGLFRAHRDKVNVA